MARDCWPVGKKSVIKLPGLYGGSVDCARLLDWSVDGEKVAGERDVVGGRHCARLDVCSGLVGWIVESSKVTSAGG